VVFLRHRDRRPARQRDLDRDDAARETSETNEANGSDSMSGASPSPARRGAVALRRVLVAMLLGVVVYGGFAVWRGLDRLGGALAIFHW
jgi:hypothetical protein